MDFEFGDALQSLRPGAEWVSVSGDYENIQWLSEDMEKPTKTEIEMEIRRLRGEKPWKELRTERNKRIAQTDYLAIPDYPHASEEAKQAWLDYRQALRDLPANTTDPENPIWPIAPSS
jgi:hypothetical protein